MAFANHGFIAQGPYHQQSLTTGAAFDTTDMLMNDAAEKMAFCGPVWFAERTGTKSITRVGFNFGSVTKSGGSGLTVSLQDVSTTADPMRPDGAQDQTVAVANGDAGFVSNTWYRTGALSASRSVAFGEMLAVVIEWDGLGRLGSDSVVLRCVNGSEVTHFSVSTLLFDNGFALDWYSREVMPNLVLEFSDGTFGTLFGAFPCSNIGSVNFTAASSPDEIGLEFSVPVAETVEGASFGFQLTGTAGDSELTLYNGTTVVERQEMPAYAGGDTTSSICWNSTLFDVPRALTPLTAYILAVAALSTGNIRIAWHEVADAGHWACHVGSSSWAYITRTNGGAWSAPTPLRRMFMVPAIAEQPDMTCTCACAPRTEYGGGAGYSACCAPTVEGADPTAPLAFFAGCLGHGSGGPDSVNGSDAESWAD